MRKIKLDFARNTKRNMLANAVTEPKMRAKVMAKYPPSETYDSKQSAYDLENHESGLFGPVRIRPLSQCGKSG